MEKEVTYRYPGASPFQDARHDRSIFFGRERESRRLYQMISGVNLLVLVGETGVGKTSLLNAGAMPILRENDFIPLPIRFDDSGVDPMQAIYSAIDDMAERTKPGDAADNRGGLHGFFSIAEFRTPGGRPLTPILIFDQFEDLFIHHTPRRRERLIAELAALTRERPLKTSPSPIQPDPSPAPGAPRPDIKINISIREDFLVPLEEMAAKIPNILHNRFRLLPFNLEQARRAIIEPARREVEKVCAPPFTYRPEAVEAMLDFLRERRRGDNKILLNQVEPFQLQVLCRHIEDKMVLGSAKRIIQKKDLGGDAGMDKILKEFVMNQMTVKRSIWDPGNVIRLCGKGLIGASNRRLSLEQEEIEKKYGVTKKELSTLVDKRLLRAEHCGEGVYYGLSHDGLVEIVRELQRKFFWSKFIVFAYFAVFLILMATKTFFFPLLFETLSFRVSWHYRELTAHVGNLDFDEAQKSFDRIMAIDDKFARAYVAFGRSIERDRPERAIEIYEEAIENDVHDGSIYYSLADRFRCKGELEKAIAYYKKAVKIDPNSTKGYYGIGEVFRRQGKCEEATRQYKKALNIDPDYISGYVGLGHAFSGQGRYEEAAMQYKKVLEIDPNNTSGRIELGKMHYYLGGHEEAIKQLEKALEIDPSSTKGYYGLGEVFRRQGKYEEAIKQYKKALEIDPDYTYGHIGLGYAFSGQGRYDEAIERHKRAREIDPDNAYGYMGLGHAFSGQGRYEEAALQYKKVLEIDPNNTSGRIELGKMHYYLGGREEAIKQLEKALEIDPNSTKGYYGLGEVFRSQGKYEEAIRQYKKALEIDPDYTFGYIGLGHAFSGQGRSEEAAMQYKKALEMEPNNKYVHQELGKTNYQP